MTVFSVIIVACRHFVKIELDAMCVSIPDEKISITQFNLVSIRNYMPPNQCNYLRHFAKSLPDNLVETGLYVSQCL